MNLFSQNDPTFDETIINFLNYILVSKSKATYDIYNDIFLCKLKINKNLISANIDRKDKQVEIIQSFDAYIMNMQYSVSTKNLHRSCINSYMKFVCRTWKFFCNKKFPHAKINKRLPKDIDKSYLLEIILTLEKKRYSWLDYRNLSLIVFLYSTGVRISEALSVKRKHLNYMQNSLIIFSSKNYSERVVYFPDKALVHISEYIERIPFKHKPSTLWINKNGGELSSDAASKMVKRLIGSSAHALRHSYATHMYEAGCELSVLSELMGHLSLNSTMIYTNIRKQSLKECINNHHPMRSFKS